MRIVSWLIVGGSITALAWTGVYPLVGGFELPSVAMYQAVGTVADASIGRTFEVQQPPRMAQAEDRTVAVFTGSESRLTREFEVQAPWILDWRVTSAGGYELAVDVSLEEAGTSAHAGSVLRTKTTGNGVRLFDQGGQFYFRVNSAFAKWSLKVVELTPEEAAAYTPITSGD